MARDKTITGIDVGTSKITTVIASVQEEGDMRVVGVSTVPSKGMKKGQIINIDEATAAISQSLEAAERMAGSSISNAFLSVGGNQIASINSHGVVAIADPDRGISATDVNRVIDAAKAISLPSSREIVHVIPRWFTVDGQDGINDPVNMTGVRLEVDTHIVTGSSIAIRNLYKCVEALGVDGDAVVFSGLASSYATLADEKELGVVLVDIGGGTTDVAIFIEGALSYSAVIPIGAIHITKDVAAGLRVSLESAEKIKIAVGQIDRIPALPKEEDEGLTPAKKIEKQDEMDVSGLHLMEEIRPISKKTLIEGIIKPRLNEIFTMVGLEIKKSGFGGMTPAGVVLTGGGSLTVQAVETARRTLAMPVHIGTPKNISGLIDEITNPAYTTCVGLLMYGSKSEHGGNSSVMKGFGKLRDNLPMKSMAGKVIDLIKSLLP